MRNFFVNPSGDYIDVQRHDPDDFGYAFQMCRVDEPQFGSFCELEYHAPALGALPDPTRSEDISQVWAFRGPRERSTPSHSKLLGAETMSLSMIDAEVPGGALGLWWLGQAGFVFKTPAGKIIYLDPYLSDAVERLHRLQAAVAAADRGRRSSGRPGRA